MEARFSTAKKGAINMESGGVKIKLADIGYNWKYQVKCGF